jgi:hypothetical protein
LGALGSVGTGGVRPRPHPGPMANSDIRARMTWRRTVWYGWGSAEEAAGSSICSHCCLRNIASRARRRREGTARRDGLVVVAQTARCAGVCMPSRVRVAAVLRCPFEITVFK